MNSYLLSKFTPTFDAHDFTLTDWHLNSESDHPSLIETEKHFLEIEKLN